MTPGPTQPARLPPLGLEGLDPSWSRLVTVEADTSAYTFHVLDTMPDSGAELTVLCVHGNPTWSFLWRNLLRSLPTGVRGIAVDHLDMGFSERTGTKRRLAQRIDDLGALTEALDLDGPVVTVAHDWGGPISLGWAQRHLPQLRGVVLTNTAVHQPEGASAPTVIRATRTRGVLRRATVDTTAFINGAFAMSRPPTPKAAREGFLAPYDVAVRREAIEFFVEDIPLEPSHPTAATLDGVADGLAALHSTPTLLLWGARDLVFSDLYLHDLEARLPHAEVHRYPKAGHFVGEDADVAGAIVDWLGTLGTERPSSPEQTDSTTLLSRIAAPELSDTLAIREMTDTRRTITFGALSRRIDATASGLRSIDVEPGDRVALMIPPGVDLAIALYACWRLGAVVVLVDGGLGPKQMGEALRAANPKHLIGIPKALAARRALRWPGRPICSESLSGPQRRLFGVEHDLVSIVSNSTADMPLPRADDEAAVVFTSGSTGPSKGVRYTHRQVAAQRDAIIDTYGITAGDRLVAAFAPFALYGPSMGITSLVPDMDVTAPGSLDARSLAHAVEAVDATMVFASPAALENCIRTAADIPDGEREALTGVRVLLSAGAPVRASLLHAATAIFPNAIAHTPYGMTEVLPVASISLPELDDAGPGPGVCVGVPLPDVDVQLRVLDVVGRVGDGCTTKPQVLGEVVVRAPHARTSYDRLWHTTFLASQPVGWHATGDVGQLDESGRLWIGGRLAHVIASANGLITPVAIEKAVEAIEGIHSASAVGIGPAGTQQVVVVVQRDEPARRPRQASLEMIDAVRAATTVDIAAVFEVPELPVDRRHNSKIDRTRLSTWAADVLAGGAMGQP